VFLDELSSFPHGRHDDCVDALAGAHHYLSRKPKGTMRISVPRGRMARGPAYGLDPIVGTASTIGDRTYDTRYLDR